MKQRDLILGLGVLSAFALSAASPYTGSVPPAEGSGDFYLYQVETGKWLQNNQRVDGNWTTRGELDKNGFDVAVSVVDGGYKLDPKLNGNGSINANNWYLDTGDAQSVWTFEAVDADGVSNAYRIVSYNPGPGDSKDYPHVLGADANGNLTTMENDAVDTTWQLVTREERIEKMLDGTNTDASWLIPGQDFGRNDKRANLWVHKFVSNGSGIGHNGVMFNATREAWNNATDYVHYVTLTNIPNGTYKFSFRGYYRDASVEDKDCQQRMLDGTSVLRAKYYAGGAEATVQNIAALGQEVRPFDENWYGISGNVDGAPVVYEVPNSMNCATRFFAVTGGGLNPWIETVVTDGTLTVGVVKLEGAGGDWLIYDDFQLEFVSDETTGADNTAILESLNSVIEKLQAVAVNDVANNLLTEAREAAAGTNGEAMRQAYLKIIPMLTAFGRGASEIAYFNEILPLAKAEGADVTRPVNEFNAATDQGSFSEALKQLRWARRRAHAERSNLEYKGHAAEPGDYYLFNVGQKQFLAPGSDWGAHAALGFPGIEVTLEANYDGDNDGTFHIDTHCYNGGNNHYLNYRGYLDCSKSGAWKFIPVEGKENVYRIEQNDYAGVVVAYNPDASTDGNSRDETTVGCENRDFQGPAEDAEWMLITRAERDEMLETATAAKPVDATFFMQNPSFCQRADVDKWSASFPQRGENRPDFVIESWNTENCDLGTTVEGLPAGVYRLTANAYYRNGDHQTAFNEDGSIRLMGQPDTEAASYAYLYAGNNPERDVPVPNILEGSNAAPGEGANVTSIEGVQYNYPQYVDQAHKFFRVGAYKVQTFFEVENDGDQVNLGIYKDTRDHEYDWIVADNFRLSYYGPDAVIDDIITGVEEVTAVPDVEAKRDNRIFNLQGVQVTNTNVPGIYIQNGKKFVVK